MLSVIQNFNDYFIDTYNYYKELSKEVKVMFKSFYDPEVEKRGEQKGIKIGSEREKENIARNLLHKGMNYEFVVETTGLSIERVKEIAKDIIN